MGWMVAPEKYGYILISGSYECDLEEEFLQMLLDKDLEMSPSWIVQVGPKSKEKCPQKRHTEKKR